MINWLVFHFLCVWLISFGVSKKLIWSKELELILPLVINKELKTMAVLKTKQQNAMANSLTKLL